MEMTVGKKNCRTDSNGCLCFSGGEYSKTRVRLNVVLDISITFISFEMFISHFKNRKISDYLKSKEIFHNIVFFTLILSHSHFFSSKSSSPNFIA